LAFAWGAPSSVNFSADGYHRSVNISQPTDAVSSPLRPIASSQQATSAAFDRGAGKSTSAPAAAIDRTSTIPHPSRPYCFARDRAANGPRAQHDARPCDTTDGIVHVLAIHHGTGLLGACGYEPSYQHRS
jgi:hypothetical protein